jgi:hypothetical protein
MRSTPRRFLAAILLTAAAGFALSQEASAPLPMPAPDVAAPVAVLPQLPVAAVEPVPDPSAPAVNPALTVDPSILTVAPAAAAIAQVPEPEKPVVTTSTRTRRSAAKPVAKPVAKPAVEATESFQSVPAPAAAGTADPSTFQGLTPPDAAATSALPKSIAPVPAARSATVENQPPQTIPQKKLGIGSWILGTILVLALAVTAIRFMRGQKRSPTSIVDFTDIHPELKAAVVRRP